MTRISLKEAYDNRDVIAWLVKHQDEIDEMMNILKNINPDGDLTNIVLKTGDQTIDGTKTFIGKIVADCDIIQNGAAYETHAEQIFSQNDYLVMRDGQLSGLAAGSYSGLQVKKYDGTQDCRLVVDNEGVARVGDINDEQPLLTRDETTDMTSGNFVLWDGVNKKAITSSLGPGGVVTGSGDIGSDTKPVKVVNGVATPVSEDLMVNKYMLVKTGTGYRIYRIGVFVYVEFDAFPTGTNTITNAPKASAWASAPLGGSNTLFASQATIALNSTTINISPSGENRYGSLIYLTDAA